MKRILFYLFVLITLQPSTTRAQQLSTLRYWFDNDASRIYTQPFRFTAGDEVDVLLDASALTSGLHSIVIQVARGDSVFSPTEAALFVKMTPSPPRTVRKRTLYYWFDQNHGAQSSIDLSSTTNETNLLISTTTLPEGLHTLNTYIVDESGERSPVFSGLFLKVPSGDAAHKVVAARYSFNDKSWNKLEIPIVNPSSTVDIITEIPINGLLPGENTLHLEIENSAGFIKYEDHTFINTVGLNNAMKIVTLKPNINKSIYFVKEYATVHLYYQILDVYDKPIPGIRVEYLLQGLNQKFVSEPSDEKGMVDLKLSVWGDDVNDASDDFIKKDQSDILAFSRLITPDTANVMILKNEFTGTQIEVEQYGASKKTYGFLSGVNLSTKIREEGFTFSVKGSFENVNKTQISYGYSKDALSILEYKLKSDLKVESGVSLMPFNLPSKDLSYKTERTVDLIKNANNPLIPLVLLRDLLNNSGRWMHAENLLFAIALDNLILNKVDTTTQSERKNTTETKLSGGVGFESNNVKFAAEASVTGVSVGKTQKFIGPMVTSTSKDLKLIVESGVDIGVNIPNVFSLGGGYSTNSSVSLSRELEESTQKLIGGIVKSEYKQKIEGELEVAINEILTFGIGAEYSKTAIMENKFGENFLNSNFNNTANAPLSLQYLISPSVTIYFNKVHKETEELPISYLATQPIQQTQTSLEEDMVTKYKKEYEGLGKISLGIKKDFEIFKINFFKDIGAFYKNEYLILEKYYHADTKKHLVITEYKDTDKPDFFDSPIFNLNQTINNLLISFRDDLTASIKGVSNFVSDFVGSVKKIFSNDKRLYSSTLTRYAQLRSTPQENRSILTFEISEEEKAFKANTEFKFNYYYPGGDLFGTTVAKDTFLIISDVFFLQAIQAGDTLKTAPNGKFNLINTVGADDLSIFDLSASTPVSVYYKPINEENWQNLGAANSTLQIDGLGVYALGISVKTDTISPTITINKPQNKNVLYITVKDNIGIQWKSTSIIVNGIARQHEKSGDGLAIVNLNTEEIGKELYVKVMIKDLAGNQASRYVEFGTEPFTVNAIANPVYGGKIESSGGYTYGIDHQLTATSEKGFTFANWVNSNGAVLSEDTTLHFIVTQDTALTANFALAPIVETVQPTEQVLTGSITVFPTNGYTYSINGVNYQTSNVFSGLAVGSYNVTLKDEKGNVTQPILVTLNTSGILTAKNYQIKITHAACPGSNDGKIDITTEKSYNYTVTLKGNNNKTEKFTGTSYSLTGLSAGTYQLCFTIEGLGSYSQCFDVVINQPQDLSVFKSGVSGSRAVYTLSGGTRYAIDCNGKTMETTEKTVEIPLRRGRNVIRITTDSQCHGVYEDVVYSNESDDVILFPNPTTGQFSIIVPSEDNEVTVEIVSMIGQTLIKEKKTVQTNRLVNMNVYSLSNGVYLVKVSGKTVNSVVRLLKNNR